MAKTSNAQRAADLVTLFKSRGEKVQSVEIKGGAITVWFKETKEPVHELDFIDWKADKGKKNNLPKHVYEKVEDVTRLKHFI